MSFSCWRPLVLLVAISVIPMAQAAEQSNATLAGSYRDWFVYRAGEGDSLNCFALSKPRSSDPGNLERSEIAFLVSSWPASNKQHEPSIVAGYPYSENPNVRVQIGGDQFEFGLTRNNGEVGGAWMAETAQEGRLINSMKGGAEMVVIGTSANGTLTRDTYSLAGITAALDSIETGCN
jgi:hypothetical protein